MRGVSRRNKAKKEGFLKKSETFEIKLWHKITNNKLLMLILTGLAIVLSTTSVYVYKGIQADLDNFSYVMIDTINVIENATTVCKTTTVNSPMMQYFLADKLYATHKELLDNLGSLLKQRSILGRHISYQTYLESANLVCWGNALFISGMQLCTMASLKPPHTMDMWRKHIVSSVIHDKEHHQQIAVILHDYYAFITSLVSIRKAAYEDAYPQAPKCDLNKISQHIDSLGKE